MQIPGFYDGVAELPAEERQAWAALPFDEAAFLGEIGLTQSVGEAGDSPAGAHLGAANLRPARHLGRLHGPGSKTVIATRASAKLSFRTVPKQDPAKILQALRTFLDERTPPDCKWTIEEMGASAGNSRAKQRAVHAGRARGARRYLRQARRYGRLRRLDPRRGPFAEGTGPRLRSW